MILQSLCSFLFRLLAKIVPYAAFALLLVFSSFVWANDGGNLSGTVADPSGAVIAGAVVGLRNTASGAQVTTATAADGSYAFASLAAGSYQLTIEAPGFKPFRRDGLEIERDTAAKIDAKLELATDQHSVTVSDAGVLIETSSTQLGERVGGAKISGIPLNGRSFTDLVGLQPGILPASSQQPNAVVMSGATSAPPSGDLNPGNVSISGQRETANGFILNGSTVQEAFNMGTAIVPNLDSIQELRVLTSNFDAEYGNYSGGQVLVATKSGTNQFHGSAFEFLRNTALDARNYFSSERAKFDRNQFGAAVGGPTMLDKLFFFADYQGTRLTQGIDTGRISVPSLTDRGGDLSDLASALTGTVSGMYWAGLLSRKLGYAVHPGEPYYTAGCVNSSQCLLPNAHVSESVWSAPAKSLLAFIPKPNQLGDVFSTSAYNQTLRDEKGSMRLDANTRWGTLSVYYFLDDYFLDNPYPTGQGGANVPGFDAVTAGWAQLFNLSLTKTFGASMVNEFHISYLRDANNVGRPVGGVGPSLVSQGFVDATGNATIHALSPEIEGVENVSFNDFTIGIDTTGETQVNNTYQWADNVSQVIGRHTLKFGGAFHLDQININPDAVYNGSFQFTGTETGSDFADFLLGVASYYRQGDSRSFYPRNRYMGVYGQDSWQLTPNLTINYGLRWDVLPPWQEKYNQIQTLVLGEQSVVYPGAPRGLVFPGDPGIPATLAPTKYTNFAPRFGLAYSPKFEGGIAGKIFGGPAKTSIRAGFGMFYTAFEGLSAGIMSANPPYGYDYDSTGGRPLFANPFVSATTGQSVGQPFPSPIPAFGASAKKPNTTVDWSKYDPITGVPSFFHRNLPPYSESYTVSIQRQVAESTVLSLGYVGTQAHHLLVLISANPGNPALCLATPGCGPFSETGVRAPFSSRFDAVTYQKTIANSNYNALEASLRHNRGPLEFMIGYTYSKSIDQSSSLAEAVNPIDPRLSRAISAFDMTHNFVASYRYELPLRSFLHGPERLTNGWAISGITRFSTGFPVTLYNNNDTSLLGTIPNEINNNGADTPNLAPGRLELNTNPRNGRPAVNVDLFSLPTLGQMGNSPRRFFHGPGIENFDMALEKSMRLSETKSLQFRVEAFNAFNHAQFYGPAAVNGNISSSNFGQVVTSAPPRLVQLAARMIF